MTMCVSTTLSKGSSILIPMTGQISAVTVPDKRAIEGGKVDVDREIPSVPFEYLRIEFPSEFWRFPTVVTTITASIEQFFVGLLPKDSRIEQVYWASEDDILKVWTVIPEPDFSLEEPIYAAQVAFMEAFPEYLCDFLVIYRFGKSPNAIKPQSSRQVF